MALPQHIEKWTADYRCKRYPDAVATVERIYNKYYPLKQQFISKLKNPRPYMEESLMKDVSPEDSKEFMAALSKLIPTSLYVKRCGRGHRHGKKQWCNTLPVDKAERFSIYIYQRFGR
jgi:hypothetical protein